MDQIFNSTYIDKQNITIFKVPELVRTHVFVSDKFRDYILASKLRGFEFQEEWDSDYIVGIDYVREKKYNSFMEDMKKRESKPFAWEQAYQKV